MDSQFLYVPKYFDMLVSSTGQLSGKIRYRRIIEIGKKNIWLAARCKNTCVKEEPEVVDWIIRRCVILYQKFKDIQSLVALFELHEYGVLGYLLGLVNEKGVLKKNIGKILVDTVDISTAFTELVEFLDFSFGLKLFYRFVELGYIFDVRAYNKLIAMAKTSEDVQELTKVMSSYGVDADAITYFYLLRKEKSYKSSLVYFTQFKNVVDFINQADLVEEAYVIMSKKCENYDDLQTLYLDYQSINSKNSYPFLFNENYFGTTILLCKDEIEAKKVFDTYVNGLLSQIQKEIENPSIKKTRIKKKKRLISSLSNYYLRRLVQSSVDYDAFLSILQNLIDLIVVQLRVPVSCLDYSISLAQMIKKEENFAKGKKMIELMLKHKQKVTPICMEQLLGLAMSKDEIDFVIDNVKCKKIKPQVVVALLSRANIDIASYFYERLKEKDYPMNLYIYNALIKSDTLHHSLYLIDQMMKNGINPDIQTIQPLLRKWNSIQDLEQIILKAILSKIDADQKSVFAITRHATALKLEAELIDYSYEKGRMHRTIYNSSWRQAIIKASNALIG